MKKRHVFFYKLARLLVIGFTRIKFGYRFRYVYEGFFAMFGMLTGTISSGVLLLREIDPEMKTPASNDLITGSSFGIVFGVPMLLLISYAAQGTAAVFISFVLIIIYLAALMLFMLKAGKKKEKQD